MHIRDRLTQAHRALRSVCVTGTNGKTTTTSLVAAIVRASGEHSARVTTLGAWVDDELLSEEQTLEAFAAAVEAAVRRGVRTIAVETTSKALAGGFAHAWPAHASLFTNLSRDHLDYHGTPEHYLAAKAQLFMTLPPDGVAVLNVCDPASALIEEVCPRGVRRMGYAPGVPSPDCAAIPIELAAEKVTVSAAGTRVSLAPGGLADQLGGELSLNLIGDVHASNALAAALGALSMGYAPAAIASGLTTFDGVPGRFEVVARQPLVIVDYAHTPDALARSLMLARRFASHGWREDQPARSGTGRVICVFGCGGERDRGKRSEMGAVAGKYGDVAIVTTDNPRSEDPGLIADEIQRGAHRGRARWVRVLDRGEAIRTAIGLAEPERDVVLIAGKGHEQGQIVGTRTIAFSDAQVARAACKSRGLHEERV